MPPIELSRLQPWYAKLLRLEDKVERQGEEFRVTLEAHKSVERALVPLQAGQATNREVLVAAATVIYATAVCDMGFDGPPGTPALFGPHLAPWIRVDASGGWTVAAEAPPGLPFAEVLKATLLVTGLLQKDSLRSFGGLTSELLYQIEEGVRQQPGYAAELEQLGTPLTLPLLQHLLLKRQQYILFDLLKEGIAPPGASEVLHTAAKKSVELGARPADAHRDMALALHCLFKDVRGAYQHAMCARLAAAAAGQESQQALACYESAMYLMQGALGGMVKKAAVKQLVQEAEELRAKFKRWATVRVLSQLDDHSNQLQQMLRFAAQGTDAGFRRRGLLTPVVLHRTSEGRSIQPLTRISPPTCAACGGRLLKTLKCGGCAQVSYCSTVCQRRHRDDHKEACQRVQAQLAAASGSSSGAQPAAASGGE